MIKYRINRLFILTLLSHILLSSTLISRDKALALPQEEVLQKLATITVFTIGNDRGDFLLVKNSNNKDIALLYLSQQEAQQAIQKLKQKNPENSYQIIPVSLANMYQFAKEKRGQENAPLLELIPVQREVEAAKSLLRQQNQSVNQFEGVPVFYITYQQEQQENFLTAKNGERSIIPFYFEKETLQNQLTKIRQEQSEIADTLQIKVMPLENLIILFEQKDNEGVRKMVLIPPQETIEFLRQFQQQPR